MIPKIIDEKQYLDLIENKLSSLLLFVKINLVLQLVRVRRPAPSEIPQGGNAARVGS